MAGSDSFRQKMKNWLREVLSCCKDKDDEEEWRPVIGQPFDFRREDVCIAGLSSADFRDRQEGLRVRAVADANRMFATLQPISPNSHSHSQSTYSNNPDNKNNLSASASPPPPRLDRMKAHTRALSNSLKTATASVVTSSTPKGGYASLPMQNSPLLGHGEDQSTSSLAMLTASGGTKERGGNRYEMRQLLPHGSGDKRDGNVFGGMTDGSMETTWAGCEVDDGDSGKGMTGNEGYMRTI